MGRGEGGGPPLLRSQVQRAGAADRIRYAVPEALEPDPRLLVAALIREAQAQPPLHRRTAVAARLLNQRHELWMIKVRVGDVEVEE